jgi:phage shock protein A
MALINRMARLFTADLHAVLDRMEEPDVLLKQAVREMEEVVAASERRIAVLEHERDLLASRHRQIETALPELAEQLDVCFTSGSDDLARKLVRRRLETERSAAALAERIKAADKAIDAVRGELDGQREQLEMVRQKAELFSGEDEARSQQHGYDIHGMESMVGEDEVEVAFLREKQRRTRS